MPIIGIIGGIVSAKQFYLFNGNVFVGSILGLLAGLLLDLICFGPLVIMMNNKYFLRRFFMDAYDYYERGKEYLEKEDYTHANENFWKAQAMVFDPDKVEMLREKSKEFDPKVVAFSSMETLRQSLGITE